MITRRSALVAGLGAGLSLPALQARAQMRSTRFTLDWAFSGAFAIAAHRLG